MFLKPFVDGLTSAFFEWFATTVVWKWFASRILGHLTFRVWSYPKFPMPDFFKITDLTTDDSYQSQDFYAFVSSDYDSAASKLIRLVTGKGSHFTHAGLYIPGTDRDAKLMHMLGDGLMIQHPLTQFRKCDYVAIVKIPLKAEHEAEARARIAWLVENQAKLRYDYEQDLDNDANSLYCSELFHYVFQGLSTDAALAPHKVLGKQAFAPDQVVQVGCVVYSNHPEVLAEC